MNATAPTNLVVGLTSTANDRACGRTPKALSTLSQKGATVAENGDLPKTARKEETATVALFCNSRRFRRQIVADFGDSVDCRL